MEDIDEVDKIVPNMEHNGDNSGAFNKIEYLVILFKSAGSINKLRLQ
jgi:hypothetical protein